MISTTLLAPEILIARAARDLDWSLLLDRLAGLTTSEPGARRMRARELERDWDAAYASMVRTAECLSLTNDGLPLPTGDLPELGDLVSSLERGVIATGMELRDLGRMLESARVLRAFITNQEAGRPTLAAWLKTPQSIDRLSERLQRSIDNEGALRDDASPALARARNRAKQARQELIVQLKHVMHKHADVLRDQYYSERDGRYVVPVRADAHRAIDGVVLDTSASGNTLFLEPRELTHHSNCLRVAIADVAHEEQRLLRELSGCAKELAPELHQAENACIEADVLGAIARWAKQCQAVAVLPEQEPVLDLRSARHPLLVGQTEVVANDLAIEAGRALVLSGPNAGGKTVTLKCLGLAARMARAGIPLCVGERSRIGFFSSVYTEIGDSQSILASLSTFSAHMLVLASILTAIDDRTMVLLDEVAGGTDPEQGAALATAYLEALLERRVAVAATTHYEALKELGNTDTRFRNAAVGFDVATMMPTFRVLNGVAGPSTALAVAARFGLAETIIARANAIIPTSSRTRERLLEELASERTMAEQLRRDIERDATEQRRIRLELEDERASVRSTYQRHLEQEYRELLGRVRIARTDLETIKGRLRQVPKDKQELASIERALDGAAHTVAIGSKVAEAVRTAQSSHSVLQPSSASALSVGQRMHIARLGTDVEILEVRNNGTVRVRSGSMTMTANVGDLSPSRTRLAPDAKRSRGSKRSFEQARERLQMTTVRSTPMRTSQNTLDLRGERVDAALDRVDRFVDDLLQRGEPAGFVLHGHGTGALKQAVREHVHGLRHVIDSGAACPDDGGDAFTLLWLGD